MNIKITKKGFRLIELIVTTVIVGVLSTISVSTFNNYFGKANDAVKQQASSEMSRIVINSQIAKGEIDYSDLNNDGSPDDRDDIISFFNSQGYSIPELGDDRCIVYGYIYDNAYSIRDPNGDELSRGSEFFIVSHSNNESITISGQDFYKTYLNGSFYGKILFQGGRYTTNPTGDSYIRYNGNGNSATGVIDGYGTMDCDNPQNANPNVASGINHNFRKFNISD